MTNIDITQVRKSPKSHSLPFCAECETPLCDIVKYL